MTDVTPDQGRALAIRIARNRPLYTGGGEESDPPDETATALNSFAAQVERLTAERDAAKAVLKAHHDWHLNAGPIGLQDGEGGWIEIDNGAEYSDSLMCERAIAVLRDMPPDEPGPMPRGGITAYWWQVGILERRKRKVAEARLAEAETHLRDARDDLQDQGVFRHNETVECNICHWSWHSEIPAGEQTHSPECSITRIDTFLGGPHGQGD